MQQIDLGDNSTAAPEFVTLAVRQGDTVNISNLAGSATVNYYTAPNGTDGSATTLNAGSNANVTVPTWIQSQGVSTVQLTGGIYG
jgi:hypothetical protein